MSARIRPSASLAFVLALAVDLSLVGAGCVDYGDLATQGIDSVDTVAGESQFLVAGTDGADATMSAEEVASGAAARATTYWQPAGCITATARAAQVTYTLVDCTGPYGHVHVTGSVVVDYSRAADGLHFHATGEAIQVNGGTIDIDTTGVYTITGTTKRVVATTHGSGVGPRGTAFTRDGTYDLTWDPATSCLGVDGTWSNRAGAVHWTTTVTGYRRCASSCPATGGQIVVRGDRNALTITFDGTAAASWAEERRGRSGTVQLFCE